MTNRPENKRRVLVVGAGRRIQNNFLPALRCLENQFEVAGIYARTLDHSAPISQLWHVPLFASLDEVEFENVDAIAISVPTAANAGVLTDIKKRLSTRLAARTPILVDTPIAWNGRELRAVLPQLKGFRKITVAEDYMNYPVFCLVRRAIAMSLIGTPRSLTLTNTGFLYHGLALIRSLVNFRPVSSTSRIKLGTHGVAVNYRFHGGFEAQVLGPYRSHTTGGMVLEGDNGIITEFPIDRDKEPAKDWHVLSYGHVNGVLDHCAIRGSKGEIIEAMPEIAEMIPLPFKDKSDLNLMRTSGLMKIFKSLFDDDHLNDNYGPQNALYDSFVSQKASNGKFPFDPFLVFGTNAFNVISKVYRRGG